MEGKVTDISPPHSPISLLRTALEKAVEAKVAFVLLIKEDGSMWYDGCGYERQEVVWALERAKLKILMTN